MIQKIDSCQSLTASQIHKVFQNAYQEEALLISADDFPPLSRQVGDIQQSASQFYGYLSDQKLVAVIEVELIEQQLHIHSLTVDPAFFRQGIADKLILYVFNAFTYESAIVETAVANMPARKLYKKHGFVEFKRWTPGHGIEKVAMRVQTDLV